ncbi:histidine kinase [Rapidithrix thailandica]|uniref:Histidine kinase n=1 Tax=Rapidithrix thailandica TaxID=413964 RepID=A0AAW9SB48_9BACT
MLEHKYTILYVDDELFNLISFEAAFREFFHILKAQSGNEGLELLKQHSVDLIISDQRMPRMTGVEFLEQAIVVSPEAVRIVLTGYSDTQAIIDAINKGKVNYYLRKPYDPDEFKILLDKALEAYQLRKDKIQLIQEKEQLKLEAEKREKEHILSQLENLKNQINPHFLFNSLNSLYAMVSDREAKKFITKLSKVYRYALDFRDQQLVSLKDEMQYVDDYVYLQKTRFEDKLKFVCEIDDQMYKYFVPQSAVQLLIENAIKHNVISSKRPLEIKVLLDKNNYLLVSNSFQPRKGEVTSTGVGQNNLKERYRFLSTLQPEFYRSERDYIARIPLLKPGYSKI